MEDEAVEALSFSLWGGDTGRAGRNPSAVTEYRMLGGEEGGVAFVFVLIAIFRFLLYWMNSRVEAAVSVGGTGALAESKRSILLLRLHRLPVGERSGERFVGRRGRFLGEVRAFALMH